MQLAISAAEKNKRIKQERKVLQAWISFKSSVQGHVHPKTFWSASLSLLGHATWDSMRCDVVHCKILFILLILQSKNYKFNLEVIVIWWEILKNDKVRCVVLETQIWNVKTEDNVVQNIIVLAKKKKRSEQKILQSDTNKYRILAVIMMDICYWERTHIMNKVMPRPSSIETTNK